MSIVSLRSASNVAAVLPLNKNDYSSSTEVNTFECSMRDMHVSLHYANRYLSTLLTKIGLIPKLIFLFVEVH